MNNNNNNNSNENDTDYNEDKKTIDVLYYEKDIGDILELSDDTLFLEVVKEEEFAPVI